MDCLPYAQTPDLWNRQYSVGRWKYLSGPGERIRYHALVNITPAKATVLDLGCGAGTLLDRLLSDGFVGKYVGVDWSREAIAQARASARNREADIEFTVKDVNDYNSTGTFDHIFLSEVLYYVMSPIRLLKRTLTWLEPEGRIVASIFQPPDVHERSSELRELTTRILESFNTSEAYTVTDGSTRTSWAIIVVKAG